MEYLIELHCHSAEVSFCSAVSGAVLADIYKAKDYHAITIMNHYYREWFGRLEDMPVNDKLDKFLSGYRNAKKRGDEIGLQVILGMEIRFPENANDYLVFGLDEQILYDNPELYNLEHRKFSEFARANGLLFVQAHPFRDWMTVINPDYLDGLEIYNAHPWHKSRNELAERAYQEYSANRPGFIATVGSDCHELGHEAGAGISSGTLPKDGAELAAILRGGQYKMHKF